ncbi:MAG: response regulator transcription factor [Chloroflexi bacterium]|nr:response regulator transcription factor [Chloroflexota bacterium]
MPIRVLIADDHKVVRTGIIAELSRHDDIEVIGEAIDGEEALRLTQELKPDVLLLDIQMPKGNLKAAQVIEQLAQADNPVRVAILTGYHEGEIVQAMLQAGAAGYVLKDEDPNLISEAVRQVFTTTTPWLSPSATSELIKATATLHVDDFEKLTQQEALILRKIARGVSNEDLAEELSITVHTVKNHITSIYRKIGVNSRAAAVAYAWENGLVNREVDDY